MIQVRYVDKFREGYDLDECYENIECDSVERFVKDFVLKDHSYEEALDILCDFIEGFANVKDFVEDYYDFDYDTVLVEVYEH